LGIPAPFVQSKSLAERGADGCRSSKLNMRRIDGPYLQRMPPASGCSVVSDRDGLRSIARCNSFHPPVAVIRTWPASVTQQSARCTGDEDRRCEARPEVGVVRSGVAHQTLAADTSDEAFAESVRLGRVERRFQDGQAHRVVRQNFSRDPRRGGSWWSRQTITCSIEQEDWRGPTRVRVEGTYIKDRSKIDPDYAARL
jgi:hypothetical protein